MRRHKQLISHNPEQGRWGDCYRTCVAMVMGMEPEDVPHFCDGGGHDGIDESRDWLRARGFALWRSFYPADYSFSEIMATFEHCAPGVPIIMTAMGKRGVNHCVVALGGEIFCDPATGKADPEPFVSAASGGYWWAEVIAPLPNTATQ